MILGNNLRLNEKERASEVKDILQMINNLYPDSVPSSYLPLGFFEWQNSREGIGSGPYLRWDHLPAVNIAQVNLHNCEPVCVLSGPDDDAAAKVESFGDVLSGRSVSTYPEGMGVPICDYFTVSLFSGCTILAVSDGCSWGPAPRAAARTAANTFTEFVSKDISHANNISGVARLLLKAVNMAHGRIIAPFAEANIWDAGTTTFCGGVILSVDSDKDTQRVLRTIKIDNEHAKRHLDIRTLNDGALERLHALHVIDAEERISEVESEVESESIVSDRHDAVYAKVFVCISVGDCKAFHYEARSGQFFDITFGNRQSLDPKDPGGRMGPYLGDGEPDWRNLGLYIIPCESDDHIYICSDGVHDNLDPQKAGLVPREMGLLKGSWEEAEKSNERLVSDMKEEFALELMGTMAQTLQRHEAGSRIKALTPEMMVRQLTDYSLSLTGPSRRFMLETPHEKLEDDYRKYPGKMDHCTIVGSVADPLDMSNRPRSLKAHAGSVKAVDESPMTIPVLDKAGVELGRITIPPVYSVLRTIHLIRTQFADVIQNRTFRVARLLPGADQPEPILPHMFQALCKRVLSASDSLMIEIYQREG